MKKILITLLLAGSLFFGHALMDNEIQQVFAQDTPTSGRGSRGSIPSGSEEKDIQLNIGETAKDTKLAGTADYDPDDPDSGFGALITRILNIVVAIAALMLLFYLIMGGLEWISSGGDSSKIEKAKTKITQSIVGMLVLAGSISLFVFMQSVLNFEVLTF